MFKPLGEDLGKIKESASVVVTVVGAEKAEQPVIAMLVSDNEKTGHPVIEVFGVTSSRGEVTLMCWPGEYLILAFQDVNGSGKFEGGEPYARHGKPTPFAVGPEQHLDVEITLTTTPDPGGWENNDLNRRGIQLHERLTHFGEVVSLDDPRFAPEVAQQGMWRPLTFIDEYRAGLYLLEPFDAAKMPIVFVHGIGGSPRHFTQLIASLDRDRFQPWVFYYPSAMPLDELGAYFFKCVHQLRGLNGSPEFFLVAHSMGGLVAWSGVQRFMNEPEADGLRLFVTISSPLGGMPSAQSGVDHAPVVMPCWYDLAPGSAYLAGLFSKPLPDEVPYHMFFGFGNDDGLGSDGTVPLASQLRHEAQLQSASLTGVDATHMGILFHPVTLDKLNRVLHARHAELQPKN